MKKELSFHRKHNLLEVTYTSLVKIILGGKRDPKGQLINASFHKNNNMGYPLRVLSNSDLSAPGFSFSFPHSPLLYAWPSNHPLTAGYLCLVS